MSINTMLGLLAVYLVGVFAIILRHPPPDPRPPRTWPRTVVRYAWPVLAWPVLVTLATAVLLALLMGWRPGS